MTFEVQVFSVTAWIYLNSFRQVATIFAKCQYHSVTDCVLLRISSMYMQSTFLNTVITGNTMLTSNCWYHIAFIYDSNSRQHSLWLDIDEVNSGLVSPSNVPTDSQANISIGAGWYTNETYFDGLIDRLSLYDYALTTDEILREATLSAYYSFNDSIETDNGPNQINGTGYNIALTDGDSGQALQFPIGSTTPYFQAKSFLLFGEPTRSYAFTFWFRQNRIVVL